MEERTPECLTRDSYTVGWICALDVELAASMAMLDNELPRLPQAEGDSNTYILGQIGQHNIVLTCLPSGTTGTNAAANAATNMKRSFPNIRFCLMVGIGGGAPRVPSDDPCEDIRLGDIVVSCPSINSGGVLQYDFGKTMSEGKFVQTGVLNKPSVVLSNSVSTLRARHRKEESSIPQYISDMLKSNEKMKRHFSHPGLEHDQLFRADYEHLNGESTCRSCDTEGLVFRKSRENTDPVVHYGLIGSANQVMKHGVTRDKLHDEKNLICFEMEAAGLMDIFPCLVVRGICDYADSHKNKRWQPYAAAVAAACAKEILFSTPALEVGVKPSFNGEAIYHMLQATLYESNLDVLLSVLSVSNYTRHNSAFQSPIDYDNPKFHWASRNIDFRQWSLEQGSPILYLTGFLPEIYSLYQLSLYVADWGRAAGYSVLPIFCSAMEHEPSMATLLHIFLLSLVYCSPEEQRTPIIRSFFSKLLEKPIVEGYLYWQEGRFNEEVFLKYMKITLKSATPKELVQWLKVALNFEMQGRLLVVIDGLDVIESVDEHLDCVIPLIKYLQQVQKAKILFTSPARCRAIDRFQDFMHIEYDKERKECLKSLQFENTRYHKISQEHEGSFEWIWTHNAYEGWSASDTSKLLYIQGKPGSGKNTLTKYFNRHVSHKELSAREAIVARFFYSFREGELQRSHYNMLLSLVYDILQQDEAFFYHRCQTEYRSHQRYGPRFKWDYDSLKTIIKSLQDYLTTKRFYLIIDAVDESQEKDRREILGLFLELCSKMKHSVVKVFMASRPVAQLEARRDQFHNIIKLDDETRSDIHNYAHSQLYGLTSTAFLAQTTAYMLENAQGVFLWVRLISERLIEAHEQGYSEEEVFELLRQLPTELEDFYDHMLEKMKQNRSSIAYAAKIFAFILFARRPLTVDEVLHSIGISDSIDPDPDFIPCDISFGRRIPKSERIILSSGGNFLEIKEHNGMIEDISEIGKSELTHYIR
ncbi:purine and uridine phosphorylase [Trichoderma asperelloides]|nr:purine and uridine phosphorylase [Trichoderma asperelloides]